MNRTSPHLTTLHHTSPYFITLLQTSSHFTTLHHTSSHFPVLHITSQHIFRLSNYCSDRTYFFLFYQHLWSIFCSTLFLMNSKDKKLATKLINFNVVNHRYSTIIYETHIYVHIFVDKYICGDTHIVTAVITLQQYFR